MIFWYAAPILSGFAVYPGSTDDRRPRHGVSSIECLHLLGIPLSGILLYVAQLIGQAPHGGWFAYMPYTGIRYSPSYGHGFLRSLADLSYDLDDRRCGQLHRHHPKAARSGNDDQPHAAVSLQHPHHFLRHLFALPALTVACVFLELDRRWGTHFFQVADGGDPMLWQQLFWFFGHPWVYVIFLPATGMISMIVPVFSRRPIVGYPYIAISTILTGAGGLRRLAAPHVHVGMSDMAMSFFSAGSMTISIFTTVQVFAWVATIWKGSLCSPQPCSIAVGCDCAAGDRGT